MESAGRKPVLLEEVGEYSLRAEVVLLLASIVEGFVHAGAVGPLATSATYTTGALLQALVAATPITPVSTYERDTRVVSGSWRSMDGASVGIDLASIGLGASVCNKHPWE